MKLKNGFVSYNQFKNAMYKISSNARGSKIKTVSLWIGFYLFSNRDDHKKHTRKLSRNLSNLFHRHHKDGYYKKNFLFIEHIPDSLKLNGKGYVSFEQFLFLEEEYTRDFVHPYIETLFQKIDDELLPSFTEFQIKKAGKNKLIDKSSDHNCI